MSTFIPHPERLLLALDAGLDHEVRLIIYGRSAVWLGFKNPPADMADAEFMIYHDRITEAQLLEAFNQMKPIELTELREAFAKARPAVLKVAREAGEH